MKKIIKKLFTFFCVIILIFSFSACDTSEQGIKASRYVETQFSECDLEGEYEIVDNLQAAQLVLKESLHEKYNEEFFALNSLVLVKLMKNAQGEKDVIESYAVSESVLQINLKTVEHKSRAANEHWYCILEVTKAEITEVSTVKVMRAGVEISETYNYSLNFDNSDEKSIYTYKPSNYGYDLTLISMSLKRCKLGCYPEFDLKYINISEAIRFEYGYKGGPEPPEEYLWDAEKLANFRQSIYLYLTPQESDEKIMEIVRKLEKLDFVKSVSLVENWHYV